MVTIQSQAPLEFDLLEKFSAFCGKLICYLVDHDFVLFLFLNNKIIKL